MDVDPKQVSLLPVAPDFDPGEKYAAANRNWQGIPSIERAANGRLWATWHSGGTGETNANYALLVRSRSIMVGL